MSLRTGSLVRGKATALTVVALALALVATACGSGPSRSEVLGDVSDDVVIPAYERLASDGVALETALTDLCAEPTEAGVDAAQTALIAIRDSWSYSEALWVGPVMERRSWAVIDWPVAPEQIEELIADAEPIDVDRLARRIGADQRGLGGVEYVLGDPGDPAATVEALADERRCQYLVGIGTVVADEAAVLPADWTEDFEDGGPYRQTFVDPDGDGLDSVVNDSLFLLEAMGDLELGKALGDVDRGAAADPEAIVEGAAGLGVTDMAAHLQGLRAVLVGDVTDDAVNPGLGPLLGDDLRDRLIEQLDAADVAVDAIEGPLATAVVDDPDTVAEARAAIKAIQVTVATEVVAKLGVTIGFSDADGDTGA